MIQTIQHPEFHGDEAEYDEPDPIECAAFEFRTAASGLLRMGHDREWLIHLLDAALEQHAADEKRRDEGAAKHPVDPTEIPF